MLDPKSLSSGHEQYEMFRHKVRGKVKTYVQYDYRDEGGRLFSTVKPTLASCRQARDIWIGKIFQ
jgi:hypothetical protein